MTFITISTIIEHIIYNRQKLSVWLLKQGEGKKMENYEQEEKSIKISTLFKYLWRNIILFAAVAIGVLVIGLVYSFAIVKPTYKSEATFVVAVKVNGDADSNSVDYVNSFRIIETVANLVTEDIVLKPVADEYGLSKGQLSGMTKVSYGEMNFLISVTVENTDKELTQKLANSVVVKLIDVCDTTPALKFLKGTVAQTSEADIGTYASPNKMMCVLVSLVAGLAVGCVAVAVKVLCTPKFKNRNEVEGRLFAKVLGYFPNDKKKEKQLKAKKGGKKDKVELVDGSVRGYELYNALLNNIRYVDIQNPVRSIMLTSSVADEMKSTITCNLANCIAFNGQKVVIIDLDLRRPSICKAYKVSNENGLVELFNGECTLEDVIKHTSYGVDIIPAGKKVINPMAVIGHGSLPELIEKLKGMYDYVLIDTAPVMACADTVAVAPLCDGVLFNVAMLDVKKRVAADAIDALRMGGANVIGINVTKGTESMSDSSYYAHYYYDHYYYGDHTPKTTEEVAEAATADESNK